MYGWSWWRWIENIWWRTHRDMSSIQPIPWRKARKAHGYPRTASPQPCSNTDSVTGCAMTRLETATASLHSEGRLGCGGWPTTHRLPLVRRCRPVGLRSAHADPRMSAVFFDVISFSCGVAGRAALLGPLREARCLSAAESNVLVHGLL